MVGVNTAVTVSNIQVTCNATSTGYTVSFTINSGDPGSYTVDGSAAGIVAGVYTSAEIPSGSGYSFVVDDANSCGPVTVSQAIVLCNCITSVGDMDPTEQTECGVACITATYDATGEALDGDDALQFILHTGSGLAIVGEIARNVVATFCFDALAGMSFGTTYYISAVVGNDLGGGLVDLADPCLAGGSGHADRVLRGAHGRPDRRCDDLHRERNRPDGDLHGSGSIQPELRRRIWDCHGDQRDQYEPLHLYGEPYNHNDLLPDGYIERGVRGPTDRLCHGDGEHGGSGKQYRHRVQRDEHGFRSEL
ncbi:MAG: hypothetical protein IPJ00_11400 [Saprospirales bacterium]|nr:hypothetical protein [Saprospirales bacterium]